MTTATPEAGVDTLGLVEQRPCRRPGESGGRRGSQHLLSVRRGCSAELAAAGDAEFGEDVGEVVFDGLAAEVEFGGDFAVGHAALDESDDLVFAFGQGRCACRKPRPCRSSSMSVLVDDSAETVLSTYLEAFDPIGFNRLRHGSQGCGGGE